MYFRLPPKLSKLELRNRVIIGNLAGQYLVNFNLNNLEFINDLLCRLWNVVQEIIEHFNRKNDALVNRYYRKQILVTKKPESLIPNEGTFI